MTTSVRSETITIQVNGKTVELESAGGETPTISQWLDGLGRDPRTVAIEHNGEILPRTEYGATRLQDGDRLEVVQFVQGG